MTARAELRRHRGAILALALAVALGLGAALGAFIIAHRTERAYPEHIAAARVADLVVNPSFGTAEAARVLRNLPHVRRVTTSDLMLGGLVDSSMRTIGDAQASSDRGEVHGSTDGRYTASDRLIVDEGRAPTADREVFVTESYRPQLTRLLGHDVHVGDRIPVGFLWAGIGSTDQPADPADPLRPLGVEQLRVAGFGRLADEVLDDPVFPRQELIVGSDVIRRYTCTARAVPSSDRDAILLGIAPETCSLQYRYWALDVDDPANVASVKRTVQRRLTALNRRLPQEWRSVEDPPAYYPVVTTRKDNEDAVDHSVRPTVVALEIFGGVAALATLVVVLLAAARIVRGGRRTDDVVRALGMRRGRRVLALMVTPTIATAVGALVAVGVGVLLSPIGPVGDVGRVQPHRTFSAPTSIVLVTVLGAALALTVGIAVLALVATRRRVDHAPRAGGAGRRLAASAPPAVADGVAAAFARGRSLLPAAATVAVAAVAAAVAFGANVTALVGDSHRYGWPWQVGVLTGFGYGETDRALVAATLRDRPDVASWDELGFASGTVGRAPVAVLYGARSPDLAVVSGRLARRVGEATLGRATADRLGIHVGDRIRLDARDGPRRVRVVGTTVMPAIGQYQSDRSGLGVGAFTVLPSDQMDDHAVTFIGVHLRPGADPARVLAAIRPRVVRWDATGSPPYIYVNAVRPAEIVNADATQGAPMLLAGVLALGLLTALALSLGATVNARRRDYAVLRAVGFTTRQVARSVRWHAIAALGTGVVLGIPIGIVVGRWLWGRFAEEIGVGPDPTVPAVALLVVAVGALVGALAAAAVPARRAVRDHPAEILHAP